MPREPVPTTSNSVCGRILVGQGGDTWDPTCQKPAGHDGTCSPIRPLEALEAQGAARVAIYDRMSALRQYVEMADVHDDPGFRKAIRLNNLAHQLANAVRDYGRLL